MLEVSASFKSNVYAPIRQFDSRVTITLLGNTTVYDDSKIISIHSLEEMSVLNDTLPSNEIQVTLDNSDGDFNVLNLNNIQQVISSKPVIKIEFGLVVDAIPTEWLPMGTYYLTDWKHQSTSKTITLTANDSFTLLDNIAFAPTTKASLYDLAVAVFQTAGIASYSIDNSLQDGVSRTITENFNCRAMLQYIGIASQTAVRQDRNGAINIKRFGTLDTQSNYLTYVGQSGLYSGYGLTGAYPLVTSGAGMKNLTLDNMYEIPEITLEPSIYQLIINVYNTDGSYTAYTYTNSALSGNSGQSFTIDNPLIRSKTNADNVSKWFFKETNYNAIYKTNWRQNPALECADIVLVEDVFNSKKQTRIYKQEFTYEGYLIGYTESRGGI
ncbi:hypothetical protein V7152_14995 [Neobacillus drentensis]|uniref:hypothetical protein n=1 Tax=Neobacillus drentensis TaxID=220684 RepID=UPI002FFF19B1